MAFQVPRKYTDEEYEQELEEKSKAGASLKRLRSGRWDDIESLADEMLRRSLVGVTKYKDKADILTAWKFQMRQQREVLTASGFPDASIRKGIYRRCANPTRPELNCLSGDTEVLIRDRGMIPIRDLEGTTQQVLTSDGWGKGEFYSFGVQPLTKITLHQSRKKKEIYATGSHRWFIYGPGSKAYKSGPRQGSFHTVKRSRDSKIECLTFDLASGDMLICKFPALLTAQTTPSAFGVAHGFTFGDGSTKTQTRNRKGSRYYDPEMIEMPGGGCYADLFGEKDACVLPYFPNPHLGFYPRPDVSVETVRVMGLPNFFKRFPDLDESTPYLYGWLAGYLAADGDVDKDGYCRISSHIRENLVFVQNLCHRLGIKVGEPDASHGVNAFTGEPGYVMWSIYIDKWSLTEKFFIIDEHRKRWKMATDGKSPNEQFGWVVDSVERVGEEKVYCAVVPSTEDFVIEGYILSGNSRDGVARARTRFNNTQESHESRADI